MGWRLAKSERRNKKGWFGRFVSMFGFHGFHGHCLANICWCQVHRAIALEEKGRFAQAAEKFEAALRTYSDAGRSRPKLWQRLEECRRKLEPDGGIISSSLLDERNEGDPFARARSRRAIARAQEGALAATAIQSAFRGKRDRNQLAATRSK